MIVNMDRLFTWSTSILLVLGLAVVEVEMERAGRAWKATGTPRVTYVQQLSEPGSSRQKETRTSITYAHAGLAS